METIALFLSTLIMSAGAGILSVFQIVQGEAPSALGNVTLLAY